MLYIQNPAFTYSVDCIHYLGSMETDAAQIHNSVIVHGIGEFRVFISMIGA